MITQIVKVSRNDSKEIGHRIGLKYAVLYTKHTQYDASYYIMGSWERVSKSKMHLVTPEKQN